MVKKFLFFSFIKAPLISGPPSYGVRSHIGFLHRGRYSQCNVLKRRGVGSILYVNTREQNEMAKILFYHVYFPDLCVAFASSSLQLLPYNHFFFIFLSVYARAYPFFSRRATLSLSLLHTHIQTRHCYRISAACIIAKVFIHRVEITLKSYPFDFYLKRQNIF